VLIIMACGRLALLLPLLSLALIQQIRVLSRYYSLQFPADSLSLPLTAEVLRQISPIRDFSLSLWVKTDTSPLSGDLIFSLDGPKGNLLALKFIETEKIGVDMQYFEIGGGVYTGGRASHSYLQSDRSWHYVGIGVSLGNNGLLLCLDGTCSETKYQCNDWRELNTDCSLNIAVKGYGWTVFQGRVGDLVLYSNTYMSASALLADRTAKTAPPGCTSVFSGTFYDSCTEFALLVGLSTLSVSGYSVDIPANYPLSYTSSSSSVFYGRTYNPTDYIVSGYIGSSGALMLTSTSGTAILTAASNTLILAAATSGSISVCSVIDGFIYFELKVTAGVTAELSCAGFNGSISLSIHSNTSNIYLKGNFYSVKWMPISTSPSAVYPPALDFTQGCSGLTGATCTTCSAGYYPLAGRCAPCHPYCVTCTTAGNAHCVACSTGHYVQPGLATYCRPFCPTGYSPNSSNVCVQAADMLRSVTFENNLAGDFALSTGERLHYGNEENYYPNYDFMDPFPVNQRGVYFKSHGTIFMEAAQGIRVGMQFSFEFWLLPLATTDILQIPDWFYHNSLSLGISVLSNSQYDPSNSGRNGLGLCLPTSSGEHPCPPTELAVPEMRTRWYHVGLTVTYDNAKTTATISLNQQYRVYTFPGYYEMPENSGIYIGHSSSMYLYSFSFINQPRSLADLAALEGSSAVCPMHPIALGRCLPTCEPTEYVDLEGHCQACLPECELGCVKADSCSFCADPRCLKCSGYDQAAVCIQCIDGATLQAGVCECPTGQLVLNSTCTSSCQVGFYTDYQSGFCRLCPSGCLECDSSLCFKCQGEFLLVDGDCSCGSGFFVSPQLTCEKCDPICAKCTVTASNCTACFSPLGYYLGTGNTCFYCPATPGYIGALGTNAIQGSGESLDHYINQICEEKCGDGVLKGQLACDDGNLRDGDGCSSLCTIDFGWECLNISGISVCNDATPPTAHLTYIGINDNGYSFLLGFSENVTLPDDPNIEISIETATQFLFSIERSETESHSTAAIINLTPQEHVRAGALLSLSFADPQTIRDAKGNALASSQLSLKLEDSYTPTTSVTVQKAMQAAGPLAGAVASTAALNTVFGSSNFNAVWSLVDILQLINYLLYMSTALPDNLKAFLRQLSFANFEFIPSFFDSVGDEFAGPPAPFASEGVGTDFLINIGNMVTVWAALLGAFLILAILCYCLPNSRLLSRLKSLFVYSVFIRCGTESFLQLTLAVCLQLREAAPHHTFGGFSLAASLLVAVYLGLLLVLAVIKVALKSPLVLSEKQYFTRFGSLYEAFKLESRIARSFLLVQNSRRLLFIVLLVFFYQWPLLQAILCFVLSLGYLATLAICRPDKEWWLGNCIQIVSEVSLSLVHCLICVLANGNLTYETRTDIGWVSLALLLFTILAHITVMAVIQFKATKRLLGRANAYLCKNNARTETLADTERAWGEEGKRSGAIAPHTEPSFGEPTTFEPETAVDIRPVFRPIRKA